jgi:hypothetical protein
MRHLDKNNQEPVFCKETGTLVLADGELHLHNDTIEQDILEVMKWQLNNMPAYDENGEHIFDVGGEA